MVVRRSGEALDVGTTHVEQAAARDLEARGRARATVARRLLRIREARGRTERRHGLTSTVGAVPHRERLPR